MIKTNSLVIIALSLALVIVLVSFTILNFENVTATQAYTYPSYTMDIDTEPEYISVTCNGPNSVYPYLINHQITVDDPTEAIYYEYDFSFEESSSQAPTGLNFTEFSATEGGSTLYVDLICGTVPP